MMRMTVHVLIVVVFGALTLSTPLHAQARVDLPPETLTILDAGGHVPVLVVLDVPAAQLDPAESANALIAARSTAIADVQNRVLVDAFGLSLESMRDDRAALDARIAEDASGAGAGLPFPVLRHAYAYTPAMALTVNRAELTALADAEGVLRIIADGRNEVFMDASLPLIGASLLHNDGLTGQGTAVAVIDTGTDIDHPMFAGRTIASACFSSYTPETTSRCPDAGSVEIGPRAGDSCERCAVQDIHGTHVAGTAVGGTFTTTIDDTEHTLSGVAPGAYLVPVNAFSTTDDGKTTALNSDLIASLEWLYFNRMLPNPEGGDPIPLVAINMSLGGGRYNDFCHDDVRAPIIALLRGAGVATVIASGNSYFNDSVAAPACIPDAVTVGATDRDDSVADFSNSYFPVDLLAPGVGIRSATDLRDGEAPGAVALNGTSMATPHVAGAFALLASAFPDASLTDIEQALRATGRPVTDADNSMTRPRINIAAARGYLTEVESLAGPITMTPRLRYFASININRPDEPETAIYEIRNTGSSAVTVTVASIGNDAVMFGNGVRQFSVQLLAGEAFDLGVEIDLAEVVEGTQSGNIRVTAPWEGGTQSIQIPATVLGYAGPTIVQRPANDNFSSAQRLSDTSIILAGNTFGATVQAGEPDHDGQDTHGSVWYAIEAVRDGRIRVGMEGRLGRNTIAVYRGTTIAALQALAAETADNEDATVTFTAEEGETYYVAMDYAPPPNALGGEEARNFRVSIEPLAGDYDAFASALELTSPGGVALVTFAGSTAEAGEEEPLRPDFSGTIWMRATGAPGDQLRISVDQLTNVTFLTYYSGSELGNLTEIRTESASGFRAYDRTIEIPAGGLYISAQQFGTPSATDRAGEMLFRWQIASAPQFARVAAAIAPMARVVRPGGFTSALAAAAIGGTVDASECGVIPGRGSPVALRFMPLTPSAGGNGDGADIPAGSSQIFAFGGEFSTPLRPDAFGTLLTVPMQVLCENGASPNQRFLSNFYVTIADGPHLDLVASVATADPAAATLGPDGVTRFAVAAVNLGDAQSGNVYALPLTISDAEALGLMSDILFNLPDAAAGFPLAQNLPLDIGICASGTDGVCFGDGGFAPVAQLGNFRSGETRTLTVRVAGQGEAIAFSPGAHRIVIAFIQVDEFELSQWGSPRLVGMTSVAVRTTGP